MMLLQACLDKLLGSKVADVGVGHAWWEPLQHGGHMREARLLTNKRQRRPRVEGWQSVHSMPSVSSVPGGSSCSVA